MSEDITVTPAQKRFLRVLYDAPSSGLPGGEIAVRAGYRGKTHQAGGGAGRAPMWAGRVFSGLPEGLVIEDYSGNFKSYRLTPKGFAFASQLFIDA